MLPPVASLVLIVQAGASDAYLEGRIAAFETAFASRSLQAIRQPGHGPIQVSIRHALKEGRAGRVTRSFRDFEQVETWLRSMERGGTNPGEDRLPNREVRSRRRVASGVVAYENQGISHNTLYLSRIRFSTGRGGFRIVGLELYNGD